MCCRFMISAEVSSLPTTISICLVLDNFADSSFQLPGGLLALAAACLSSQGILSLPFEETLQQTTSEYFIDRGFVAKRLCFLFC